MTHFPNSPRPTTSLWGAIQQADQIAPGIWSVMTASHGGIMLSDQRQAAMPEALKIDSGSYEEDCDWSLAVLAFESELTSAKTCSASFLQLARDTARCWHPDRYAAHTGEEVPTNDSPVLRIRKAYLDAIGQFCVTAAWGDWADWVPEGKTGVIARKVANVDHLGRAEYDDDEVYALVDKIEYARRRDVTVLRDIAHEIIPTPEGLRPKRIA